MDERRRQREDALAEALALAKGGDPDAAGFLRAFSTYEVRRVLPLEVGGSAVEDILDELFAPTTLATYREGSLPPSVWIRRTAWSLVQRRLRDDFRTSLARHAGVDA